MTPCCTIFLLNVKESSKQVGTLGKEFGNELIHKQIKMKYGKFVFKDWSFWDELFPMKEPNRNFEIHGFTSIEAKKALISYLLSVARQSHALGKLGKITTREDLDKFTIKLSDDIEYYGLTNFPDEMIFDLE